MQYKTSLNRSTLRHTLWYVALSLLLMFTISLSTFFASPPRTATAATSSTMNFQARLLQSSGALVPDGYYNVQFKLYNAATSAPGTEEWTETYTQANRVRVANGYLTVNLGALTAFGTNINWDQEHWLTMNIGGTTNTPSPTWDGEMTPRLKLTAVPYAFTAGKLQQTNGGNQSTLSFANQTASRNILLPDESGTICIQGSTNCGFVTGSAGNFIQNGTTPQTGNFNVTGNGALGGSLGVGGNLTFTSPNTAIINRSASAATNAILVSRVSADSVDRFRAEANGKMSWGNGTDAMDTTLYRVGVNTLQTDGAFTSGGTIYAGGAGVSLTGAGGSILKTYSTSGSVTQNDVVVLVNDSGGKVATSTTPRDTRVLGVFRGNSGGPSGSVTIAGDAQVNAKTGVINVGDQLVVSDEAGKVMVDNNATSGILGYAISYKASGSSTVMVRLNIENGNTNPYYRINDYRIQNAAGTTDLLRIDGTNNRIAIGPNAVPGNGVLTIGTDTTDATGGLWFGTDTSLYRSSANTLQTSGGLIVGGSGNCGSIKLCVSTAALVGARINVTGGLNDSLQLQNNGVNAASFSYDGKLKVAGATTYTGALNVGTNTTNSQGGIYFGTDVNLYRSTIGSTPVLMSDNGIALKLSSATSIALQSARTGDAHPRFQVLTNGTIQWGAGSASPDVVLTYGPGGLTLDGSFRAKGFSVVSNGNFDARGADGAGRARFLTGVAGDSNTLGRFYIAATGAHYWGDGTNETDVNLYRPAANTLGTNGSLQLLGTSSNLTVQGTGTSTFAGNLGVGGSLSVTGVATFSGNLTVSGSQFTNNAATVNTAATLGNFPAGGPIGTAPTTVDVKTMFTIAQTTPGQDLSLPSPSDPTAGRVVYVLNTGITPFDMHGVSITNGYGQIYMWNGTAWVLGASGGGSAITLQSAYDGGNSINTSNARDIAFNLVDTTTDGNFLVNIASGSTGQFKVQSNGTDLMTMGATGQLALSVQGTNGGLLIGGDAKLYRHAESFLRTTGSFGAVGNIYSGHGTAGQIRLNNNGAIQFGTDQDTNLYRSAANTLATDDDFQVGGSVTATNFSGNGSGLTNLDADKITSGKLNDARLNDTVAMLNRNNQVFMGNDQTFRNGTDSATAFNIQNSASETLFNADTATQRINIGGTTSTAKLTVTGDFADASTWTLRTATAASQWSSITYGNGLFVAVAGSGTNRVMTSPDGITWTLRTAAAANTWNSVTYGNGQFVAVSGGGTNQEVMTSPDGINWTLRNSGGIYSGWNSITYGGGLFVAVGPGVDMPAVMTSPDGINWTERTGGSGWYSITYGNGLFVAVAGSGTNRVMTSPDGINWTLRTAAAVSTWYSVTYGNGQFVAIAYGGSDVMTSPDGINWTLRTAPVSQWRSVTYGNGLFVAVSYGGTNRVMTSLDGVNWTVRTVGASNYWESVTYGNGLFAAVSVDGTNRVMTSSGGYQKALTANGDVDVNGTIRSNGYEVCTTAGNCKSGGGTGDILQNGNAFGATMLLGTTDNFELQFQTNGNTALTLTTAGNAVFDGSLTATSATISGTIRVGTVSNGVDVTSSGITYNGTARPTRSIVLSPEYAGATLSADGSSNTLGALTADNSGSSDAWRNYYTWTTTQATAQDYTVMVRATLPTDFDSWDTSALAVAYRTGISGTTNNSVSLLVNNASSSPGTPMCSVAEGASTSWASATCSSASLSSWNNSNKTAVLRIKVKATNAANAMAQLGDITLQYKSKF